MELRNKKWTEAEFFKVRQQVLASWPTGSSELLNLDIAIANLKKIPAHKNFALKMAEAKKQGRTLVQPRAGVADIDRHIELMQFLEAAGADFLPSTIDSYTRQNRYAEAERGIEESRRRNRSMLNGFPAVNYGVEMCRRVADSVNVPLQARHGTPDSRLLAEIIHAAGWTSNEGGGISYNLPYAKNVSIADSLWYWQYCDRLVGYYEDHGVSLNREPFGPLTGTLVPPSISNTVSIIEALLAAEQGVKNITVGYGMCGNVIQDVAAIHTLQSQTEAYLYKYGYRDVIVTTVFHQWMAGFPADEAKAMGLIALSSTVAALSKATKMITKTPLESVGIPTKEANAQGIKASKLVVSLLKDQSFGELSQLKDEEEQIKKEVDSLLAYVFRLGEGDLAIGTVKAFELGIIDIPFAPSRFNAGKILPARDNEGIIRILDFGNLGFTDEIKDFHRKKIEERAKYEGRLVSFQMTVDDIYAVSEGELIGRPKR
ncbi:MAG TPA: methylaspartate mutase subunit E [Bacilli bacterium]|nr:MAG: Methylaspartate mutase E chain [Tenericutes bacterium ADurb.BinA124]HNZ50778.1 methylaspartate mutase subunit E [Bacilli bacterium]HPX84656.1 methylaspartate mutase subunit E [Bacilli bacterium]HQC74537.1 methylaspartate mutase subunit E [Bacilli bacterium]